MTKECYSQLDLAEAFGVGGHVHFATLMFTLRLVPSFRLNIINEMQNECLEKE